LKPTIYDVAKEAGVSIATVSKVINQTGRISDKTRAHVNKVMERLDYQPSVVASALTGKSTYTIGLLIPDLANPFFAEIARSVEDRGSELGFNLVICNTDNEPNKGIQYISLLKQKRVDGIIIATGLQNELMKGLTGQGIPLALIAREMPMLAVDTVLVDDYMGGYLATSHLIRLGHRRIAIIAEDLELMSSKERVRGYRYALEEAGIAAEERFVTESELFTLEGGKEQTRKLLEQPDGPTAIFACNDLLAIGVMQAARELGVNVPNDLSVVGFDNTILATITDPPLTTVAQPIQDIGRQVIDLLVQEINRQKTSKQRIILVPNLVVRSTTKAIAE